MNFRLSITIAELWRPEVARLGKNCNFCIFWKNDPLRINFQNSVPTAFILTPIDVLCSNFVKFGRWVIGKIGCCSPNKKPKCPGFPAVVTGALTIAWLK